MAVIKTIICEPLIKQLDELSIDESKVYFGGRHFNEQLELNQLSLSWIKYHLFNIKMYHLCKGNRKNSFELYYYAPVGFFDKMVKIVIYDNLDGELNVGTVMPSGFPNRKYKKRIVW